MCGRFIITSPGKVLAAHFELNQDPEIIPHYNIAPTQEVAAIRLNLHSNNRWLTNLKWGLVPFWSKDASIGAKLINARCETLSERPACKAAFKSRRCLIPANGFYEWRKDQGNKQPYLIQLTDGNLFAFAGLWEQWKGQKGAVLESCTIITTEANDLLKPIHDRMPVILKSKDYSLWLDPKTNQEIFQPLLIPYPSKEMKCYAVTPKVNKASYDRADSIEPLL